MRKALCFCLSFFFVIFSFGGCGEFVPPEPKKEFNAVADVLYRDMQIVCTVEQNGINNLLISVTYPDELRGFSYKWSDGAFRIGYKDLYCENATSPLPENSFATQLGTFLNNLYVENSYTFTEHIEDTCKFNYNGAEGTEFTVNTNNGQIQKIDFGNMTVEFRDYQTEQ